MGMQIFVNLPVKDVQRSKAFFAALGFAHNPQFSNDDAVCVVLSDTIYAMLLAEPFFAGFLKGTAQADATTHTEVLNCLSFDSHEELDAVYGAALANGAKAREELKQDGPMYGGSFADPDGHVWELLYWDTSITPIE